jgi:hypothetical protein
VIPNLPSGGEQLVQLTATPPAVMPPRDTAVTDVVAYIGGEELGGFRKVYRDYAPCEGARLRLRPNISSINGPTSHEERGAYITAIRGVHVCAIGMEVDLQVPGAVVARIYEASGSTRGGLLAESTTMATRPGNVTHYVPIDFELLPCREYDIAFEYGAANDFNRYNEALGFEPFDVGAAIRVRDGEYMGDASNYALPRLTIVTSSPGDYLVTDLSPEGLEWGNCADATTERGVFVTPHQTISMAALQWAANLSTVPATVNAYVFDGSGRTRGALLAKGTATVTTTGSSMHEIPLNAVLVEGREYDLVVSFPATTWACIAENQISMPFTAGEVLSVNDGELGGNPSNGILPHFAVQWAPGSGGRPLSLAKSFDGYPPPFISLDSNGSQGLYMTSLIDQEMYSIGWEADVRVGEALTASVYEASGTSRGALLSTGTSIAVEGGTRWHDITVAVGLQPGGDYNIEIGFNQMNQWAYWLDTDGMPYTPYGVFEVYASSRDGDPTWHWLIHMRVNACNAVATSVEPRPTSPARFTLEAPNPSPVSGRATMGYSIDEAGEVTIGVYDVTGRRVAMLLDGYQRTAGPGIVDVDTRGLAAGVYFVKMEVGAKSVSRKITVVR